MPTSSRPIIYGEPAASTTVPTFASTIALSTPAQSQKHKADSPALTEPSSFGLTNSATPYRASSSQPNKEGAGHSSSASRLRILSKSTSDARHAAVLTHPVAVTPTAKQPEMDELLEAEMEGSIFCDPQFMDNFLSVHDTEKLERIFAAIRNNLQGVTFNRKICQERELYNPLCRVLNGCGRGDDWVDQANNMGTAVFVDHHAEGITFHYDNITAEKLK
ncbi:hypothetical protein FRC06_010292 [Ceratobasidium sp. 370]|nr:hypothetical protein FRC06_010292 [Ceratobasidium sp. 370]